MRKMIHYTVYTLLFACGLYGLIIATIGNNPIGLATILCAYIAARLLPDPNRTYIISFFVFDVENRTKEYFTVCFDTCNYMTYELIISECTTACERKGIKNAKPYITMIKELE